MDTLARNERMSQMSGDIRKVLPALEAIYKDLHANPELSMQETRTAAIAASFI